MVSIPPILGGSTSIPSDVPSTVPGGTYIPGTSLFWNITVDTLKTLCSITSPTLNALSSVSSATTTPAVDVGDPVLLLALVPSPGASIWARDPPSSSALPDVHALPPDAIVSTNWIVQYQDSSTWNVARPASSSSDRSGHYQIVEGSLSSPYLSILPWPYPDVTDASKVRTFRAILTVSVWIPAMAGTTSSTSNPMTITITSPSWTVKSWTTALGAVDSSNQLRVTPTSIANLPVLANFSELFDIKIENPSPAIGAPVIFSLLPRDKSLTNPMTIDSIVQSNPDVKLQAALDIGAPIENILNIVKNAVSALFKGGSASSPVPSQIANGVLDVGSVLAGAISIPIAMDVKSQNLTKTLRPVANLVSPVMSAVPNTSSLLGVLPIGSLAAAIKMTSNDLSAMLNSSNPKHFIVTPALPLTSALGLSITPMPILQSAGNPDRPSSKLSVDITLKPKLTLPGLSTDITIFLPTISIEITPPVISIPQVAMFFKSSLENYDAQDILIAMDPQTYRLLPNPTLVTGALQTVLTAFNTLSNVFAKEDINQYLLQVTGDLTRMSTDAVVSCMLQMLSSANAGLSPKTVTLMRPPFPSQMFNEPTTAAQQALPGGWQGSVRAMLYLGAPALATHTLMVLNNGNSNNGNDVSFKNIASAFGFGDASDPVILSAVALGVFENSDSDNNNVSRGVWWYDFSGKKDGGSGSNDGTHVLLQSNRPSAVWASRFQGIEWTYPRYSLPGKWYGGPKIPASRK